MTTSVVQCLICKTVSRTGQTGGKGQDKNINFCPSLNHITTFVPRTIYLKYKNSFLSIKNRIRPKIIQCHKSLSRVVLSSTYCLANQTHPNAFSIFKWANC